VTGSDRAAAPGRLPVVIIFTHLGLAAAGLAMWVVYLILERMVPARHRCTRLLELWPIDDIDLFGFGQAQPTGVRWWTQLSV